MPLCRVMCVLCVIWCSAHGQIVGDPAPGRSPGPPDSNRTTDPGDGGSSNVSFGLVRDIATITATNNTSSTQPPSIVIEDNETIERERVISSLPMQRQQTRYDDNGSNPDEDDQHADATIRWCASTAVPAFIHASLDDTNEPDAGSVMTLAPTPTSPVRLEVTNEVFDVSAGLVSRIVYTGNV